MPLQHGGGAAVDGAAVGDVAELVLGAELLGERAQPLLAAGDQDAVPASCGEGAGDRLADPGRGAGDDGYALNVVPRIRRG